MTATLRLLTIDEARTAYVGVDGGIGWVTAAYLDGMCCEVFLRAPEQCGAPATHVGAVYFDDGRGWDRPIASCAKHIEKLGWTYGWVPAWVNDASHRHGNGNLPHRAGLGRLGLDGRHVPRPAAGQVWVWRSDVGFSTRVTVSMVVAVEVGEDEEIASFHHGHRRVHRVKPRDEVPSMKDYDAPWPPPLAALVAGPGAPWFPDDFPVVVEVGLP